MELVPYAEKSPKSNLKVEFLMKELCHHRAVQQHLKFIEQPLVAHSGVFLRHGWSSLGFDV